MQGCCKGGTCGFTSTCYNESIINATPLSTETDDPFAVFCTEGSETECGTWTWPALGSFVRMQCAESGFESTVYLAATWVDEDSNSYLARQVITTIDESSLSQISSNFVSGDKDTSSTLTASESVPAVTTPSKSDLPETSQSTSSESPQSTGTDGDKSHSSTSSGAIAGGVVGGLAGGAAIAAGVIFFFMRRKKKTRGENETSEELRETGYQAVPQNQSHHSSWIMPHVAEPEAAYQPEFSELSATSATQKSHSSEPLAELPERGHR